MRINRNNGNTPLQGLKTRTRTRPQEPGQGQGLDPQGQEQRPYSPGQGHGLEICP